LSTFGDFVDININSILMDSLFKNRGRCGRDRMVVTTYAISAYHY